MQTRIEAMIAAVGTVQPALDKFYGLLNDEQKARLNALGMTPWGAGGAQERVWVRIRPTTVSGRRIPARTT